MKLGTSLRFLYPTGPHTYERFTEVLAALPPGGFIERPMGAFETDVQAAQVLEVAAAARAGTLGDGWLTGQNTPDTELVRQLEGYREAAVRAGRPIRAVLRRDIFVAETEAAAHAEVDRVLAEGYRGTGKAELLVGSPETVVERLRHYRALGFEEIMVRHITGDHQQMLRSFALIGQHVMPAIRDL